MVAWSHEAELTNGKVKELHKCAETHYNNIMKDLRRLKDSQVLPSAASTHFVCIHEAGDHISVQAQEL